MRVIKKAALVVAAMVFAAMTATSANNAEQIVFSDTGALLTLSGNQNASSTPFGFWIWCQPVSNNAYGNSCAGAVYFYHLGIAVGVDGHVASFQQSGDTLAFTVTVSSVPNASKISNCIFSFSGAPSQGASNTVTLTCDKPTGTGTDSKMAIQLAPPK